MFIKSTKRTRRIFLIFFSGLLANRWNSPPLLPQANNRGLPLPGVPFFNALAYLLCPRHSARRRARYSSSCLRRSFWLRGGEPDCGSGVAAKAGLPWLVCCTRRRVCSHLGRRGGSGCSDDDVVTFVDALFELSKADR